MLYLLHGSDSYRRDERVREIREAYRKKYPEALGESIIDEETERPLDVIASALTQGGGLFGAKSLIIVRNVFSKEPKEIEELLESVSAHTRDDVVVIFSMDRLPKKFLFINTHATAEQFIPLDLTERVKWIARYVKLSAPEKGPESISKKGAQILATAVDDLGQLSQELEKLIAYCVGRESIREKDVSTLLRVQDEGKIFPISDGLAERAPQKALVAISRLVQADDEISGLIGYALKEARQLIRAHAGKGSELPGDPFTLFGAKPFVWKKRTAQASGWNTEEIQELAKRCVELDAARYGREDSRLALENFILGAVGPK